MNVTNFPPPYQNSVVSSQLLSDRPSGSPPAIFDHSPSDRQRSATVSPTATISSKATTYSLSGSQNNRAVTPSDESESALRQSEAQKRVEEKAQQAQISKEQEHIQALAARDREVRNHERAHAAAGGQYAGAPRYQYQRGPDGVNYAVAGEVSIDTSAIPGDPQATIEKAQTIRRAALAPAEPSGQDRQVAAQATQMESEARAELASQQYDERLEAQGANDSAGTGAVEDEQLANSPQHSNEDNGDDKEVPSHLFSDQLNQRLVNTGAYLHTHSAGQIISQIV